MHAPAPRRDPFSVLRSLLHNEASGGVILMASAALALIVANSPAAPAYFAVLKSYVGGLSVLHWINDGLMAVFFLLVGLEVKRELLDGQLRTWADRILPGVAALGGMMGPALVYVAINWHSPETLRGWAIPAATDAARHRMQACLKPSRSADRLVTTSSEMRTAGLAPRRRSSGSPPAALSGNGIIGG